MKRTYMNQYNHAEFKRRRYTTYLVNQFKRDKNTVQALKHLSADAVTQNGHKFDKLLPIRDANTLRPHKRINI